MSQIVKRTRLIFYTLLCCVQIKGLGFLSNVFIELYTPPLPQSHMSTPQLIHHEGYPVEEHHVTTQDGYILTLFRIPHGKHENSTHNRHDGQQQIKKEPILLQHGLLCSSNDWLLIRPPENNLAYLLVNEGYDVWLGNGRGNNYSLNSIHCDPNDLKFWDFSFTEMGWYDIPAVFDYILTKTEMRQLTYIGHSMGCTMLYIAIDRHPELNDRVKKMIALAPAVYIEHCQTPLKYLADVPSAIFQGLENLISKGRLIPSNINLYLNIYGPILCSGDIPAELCLNIIFFIAGYDRDETAHETLLMIAGHTPSDTSAHTLGHYLQYVKSGVFQGFDYGPLMNVEKYNSILPPLFNLSNVRIPMKVLYGLNDELVAPPDTQRTIRELGNVVEAGPIDHEEWQHLDFLYGHDAKTLVYEQCLEFLRK